MKTWAVILSKSNSKSASPENVFYKVVDEANLSSELELASVLISFAGRWHKLCWFAACFNKRQFCRFFLFSFCYICNKDVQTCSTWYNLQYFMFFFWFFTHNMRRVVWLRTFWGVKRTPWFGRLYKQTSGLDLPQLRLQWIQMRPPFSCILLSPYIIIVSYSIIPSIIILSASSTQGRIPGSLSRAHQSDPQRDIRNCQMIMNKQYLQPMIWGSVR